MPGHSTAGVPVAWALGHVLQCAWTLDPMLQLNRSEPPKLPALAALSCVLMRVPTVRTRVTHSPALALPRHTHPAGITCFRSPRAPATTTPVALWLPCRRPLSHAFAWKLLCLTSTYTSVRASFALVARCLRSFVARAQVLRVSPGCDAAGRGPGDTDAPPAVDRLPWRNAQGRACGRGAQTRGAHND